MAEFQRVAILGVGLLGASLGGAIRKRGLAREVWGSGRRKQALERAQREGLIDGWGTPEEVVQDADLVVLATPVGAMAEIVASVVPQLAAGCVVSDVGSVKGPVLESLAGLLPSHVHLIGAHPMAGSHHRGSEFANVQLFEGAVCVLTPQEGTDARALAQLRELWQGVGATVLERNPADHDDQVAWISHLPHALAFAYARALEAAPKRAGELLGSGFSDFTRIAMSSSALWSDILRGNRKSLAGPMQAMADSLEALARLLESGDEEQLMNWIQAGREQLDRLLTTREGIVSGKGD